MLPEVSIIIPCYNVEKYVKRCLESALNQTTYNLQIIAVNDKSSDSTAQILNSLAEKNAKLEVIHHEVNSGVAVARNSGMQIAKGKFLFFLDGDDWLPNDSIENFLKLQKANDLDLVCANARRYSDDAAIGRIENEPKGQKTLKNLHEILAEMQLYQEVFNTCWAKLFRAELVKKHRIEFHKDLRHGQDTLFTHRFMIQAKPKTMIDYDFISYCYRQNPSSIVHSIRLDKRLFSLKLLIEELDSLAVAHNLERWLSARKAAEYIWAIKKFSKNKQDRKERLDLLLKSDFYRQHIKEVIASFGKAKHRILLKVFELNFLSAISFW